MSREKREESASSDNEAMSREKREESASSDNEAMSRKKREEPSSDNKAFSVLQVWVSGFLSGALFIAVISLMFDFRPPAFQENPGRDVKSFLTGFMDYACNCEKNTSIKGVLFPYLSPTPVEIEVLEYTEPEKDPVTVKKGFKSYDRGMWQISTVNLKHDSQTPSQFYKDGARDFKIVQGALSASADVEGVPGPSCSCDMVFVLDRTTNSIIGCSLKKKRCL